MTVPKKNNSTITNVGSFLYTNGNCLSLINIDENIIVSWVSAFDRRKILGYKTVPKEIIHKRQIFKSVVQSEHKHSLLSQMLHKETRTHINI